MSRKKSQFGTKKSQFGTKKSQFGIGSRIYYIRGRVLGLSQAEFSKKVGVVHSTIGRYERESRKPPVEVLLRIAEIGGCSVEWILTGKGRGPERDRLFELLNLREIRERMKYLREKVLGISIEEIAFQLELTPEEVSKLEAGEIEPKYEILIKFADLVGVSLDFLLRGERGEKEKGFISRDRVRIEKLEQEVDFLKRFIGKEINYRMRPDKAEVISLDLSPLFPRMPVIASIPAGTPIEITQDMVIDWILAPDDALRGEKQMFGIKIEGDSMSPMLLPGDYVIVILQSVAQEHDIVVARLNGEAVIKEFTKEGAAVILRSCNSAYSPIVVSPLDAFEIIGIVYGIGLRKLK